MNFPATKKEDVAEVIHGHTIIDPYRWLEDASSEETRNWIKEQNSFVDSSLRRAAFETFSDELVSNFKVVDFSAPAIRRGRYFFGERQPDKDQGAIYFKQGLDGHATKLIDPNGMNESNSVTIDKWNPSRSGKFIAYGLSEGGAEMATLYIMNVDTKQNLPEEISHCRHPAITWLPDDSGFYYTRNPRPGTVPKNEEHLHAKVFLHLLGQSPDEDMLIFGEGRPKDDMLGISLSVDGRYLGIEVAQTFSANDLYIYDRDSKETVPLVIGILAKFSMGFLEDRVYIQTNYKANNGRVLWMPLDKILAPIDKWEELIPESGYPLEGIRATKSKILAEYSVDVCSKVLLFDYEGKEFGGIPLPQYSTLTGIAASREEEEFFYGVASLLFPKIVYRYNPLNGGYAEFRKTDNPINPEDYIVKQEWYASKDETRVPMFIYHRKDIPLGSNPLILYAYGGFGSSQAPTFNRSLAPWLERGGIYVIANIRGGGEFGKQWHEQGIKKHKQNSFDDFIAAAEYLIEKGYTSSQLLGARGASNGGLLVTAVETQRPELMKAVCAEVPLADMLRFPLFGIASRWVHEYGDPANKEEFERICTWSPYHNVKEGVEYPATLFRTAENDSRVNPLHARKMTARLQSVNKKNPIYCYTEMNAGHGVGRPIKKVVESQALLLAFFAWELGLKV